MIAILLTTYLRTGEVNLGEAMIKGLNSQIDKNFKIYLGVNDCIDYFELPKLENVDKVIRVTSNCVSKLRNRLLFETFKDDQVDRIIFFDDDDSIPENFTQILNRHFNEIPDGLITYFNHLLIKKSEVVQAISDESYETLNDDELLEDFSMMSTFAVYDKKFLSEKGLYFIENVPDPLMYEDVFFFAKLRSLISEVDYIHTPLYYYQYINTNNSVSKRKNPTLHEIFKYFSTLPGFKVARRFNYQQY